MWWLLFKVLVNQSEWEWELDRERFCQAIWRRITLLPDLALCVANYSYFCSHLNANINYYSYWLSLIDLLEASHCVGVDADWNFIWNNNNNNDNLYVAKLRCIAHLASNFPSSYRQQRIEQIGCVTFNRKQFTNRLSTGRLIQPRLILRNSKLAPTSALIVNNVRPGTSVPCQRLFFVASGPILLNRFVPVWWKNHWFMGSHGPMVV